MNRVKLMIAFVLCCAMGYAGFTACEKVTVSEAEKFMQANVEALTGDESGGITFVVCKCHDDARCYGGNRVSLRPKCSHYETGAGGDALDCSSHNSICKNLH